jgi:GMP synthase (glutamine-hydrolysing)
MKEKILIFDFGSQYTQLIARRIREADVYSEILPYNAVFELDDSIKGVVLSGSPFSVNDAGFLDFNMDKVLGKVPVLAICYGAQLLAKKLSGRVEKSSKREYGRASLEGEVLHDPIFEQVDNGSQVWMSHGDSILEIPSGFSLLASTDSIPVAAFRSEENLYNFPTYAFQFHPEVTHSVQGFQLIRNFLFNICNCEGDWTPEHFINTTISELKATIGDDHVLMALSGGVDSTVAAELLHKAIGQQLHCFFLDNGLLRKDEFESVLKSYESMGLNIKGVDCKEEFWSELKGVNDPEHKRKVIGRVFIEVFDKCAKSLPMVKWLGQGTIYPDVIESVSVHGPSVTIKSHHNVGGLPEKLNLKIVEPLRALFKDEVRRVGRSLGISNNILNRHPFPGPGLGIRIIGDITPEKVALLQEADHIFIKNLKDSGYYDEVWQAGAILLPVQSVGVMGDERTYEKVVALRSVNSVDGMTAEWSRLPYDLLAKISTDIINNVKGINRVVFDISTKPPATIEWE